MRTLRQITENIQNESVGSHHNMHISNDEYTESGHLKNAVGGHLTCPLCRQNVKYAKVRGMTIKQAETDTQHEHDTHVELEYHGHRIGTNEEVVSEAWKDYEREGHWRAEISSKHPSASFHSERNQTVAIAHSDPVKRIGSKAVGHFDQLSNKGSIHEEIVIKEQYVTAGEKVIIHKPGYLVHGQKGVVAKHGQIVNEFPRVQLENGTTIAIHHSHVKRINSTNEEVVTEAGKQPFNKLPRRGRTATGAKADKVDTKPALKLGKQSRTGGAFT